MSMEWSINIQDILMLAFILRVNKCPYRGVIYILVYAPQTLSNNGEHKKDKAGNM